jgi:hypothetical protein
MPRDRNTHSNNILWGAKCKKNVISKNISNFPLFSCIIHYLQITRLLFFPFKICFHAKRATHWTKHSVFDAYMRTREGASWDGGASY